MTNPVQPKYNNTTTQEEGERSRSRSTTTTSHTDPGVLAFDLEKIRLEYEDVLGPLNAHKAKIIEICLDNGMEAAVIIRAIHETAMAPRPTHYYLNAILCRYLYDDHILTIDDVIQDDLKHRADHAQDRADREYAWYKSY